MPRRPQISTLSDPQAPLRLVVLHGPGAGRKFVVNGGEVLGRAEDAAVSIDDPKVSREHARLVRDDSGLLAIEDLGSRNGTAVNGVAVERAPLSVGDRIQLGSEVVLLVVRYDPSEQQLLERQRLELLGRLGAGLAHDLRNVQTVILAGLDYVQSSSPGTPVDAADIRDCLEDVRLASSRATELVTRLLSLARSEEHAYVPVDVAQVCDETLKLARIAFGSGFVLEARIGTGAWVVGSGAELHQAFMNICMNARDAMPDGGKLSVTLARADKQIVVRFADTGQGMDAATASRVFEPFYTTKRKRGGFGLGLATVRDIVTAHGGRIEVESTPGRGTTFTIFLPESQAGTQRRKETAALPRIAENLTGTILLVDDDPGVRKSFGRILARAGHDVHSAEDAAEALEKLAAMAEQGKPDLVLLDRTMPGMSGDQAFARIKSRWPSLRVLLMSGTTQLEAGHARAEQLLSKPIGADELLARVADALVAAQLRDEETGDTYEP